MRQSWTCAAAGDLRHSWLLELVVDRNMSRDYYAGGGQPSADLTTLLMIACSA